MELWKTSGYKIYIKNEAEIKSMREGGRMLAQVLFEVEKLIVPGITTLELDQKAEKMIRNFGAKPSFKGYQGFPATLCISVNEQIVHGIPGDYKLKDKDVVTVDCGVFHQGFHTDSAFTVALGEPDPATQKFINTVKKALNKAIDAATPNTRIKKLSEIIQNTIEKEGYSIIQDLTGHGVGANLHEDPPILNFLGNVPDVLLRPGMTLAIEPIIAMGKPKTRILKDNWTFVTTDNSLAAQQEHTILITDGAAEILTLRPNE